MLIVLRVVHIIHPDIGTGDSVEGIVTARRQRAVIRVDGSDAEESRGRAAIPLGFVQALFVLPADARTPREPVPSKQHGPWFSDAPPSTRTALETLRAAMVRVPRRCDSDDDLAAAVEFLGAHGTWKKEQQSETGPRRSGACQSTGQSNENHGRRLDQRARALTNAATTGCFHVAGGGAGVQCPARVPSIALVVSHRAHACDVRRLLAGDAQQLRLG